MDVTSSTATIGLVQNKAESGGPVGSSDSPAPVQPAGPVSTADRDKQFVAATVAAFGPTVRHMPSGKSELNLATMSHILARRLGLVYDMAAREFLQQRPDLAYRPVSMEMVINQVAVSLQKIAACHPECFPTRELCPCRVKALVNAMKVAVVRIGPDAHDALLRFVNEGLCLKPGGNLTSSEIYTAYARFANMHKLQIYPRQAFGRELARTVFKVFLKTPSNSILRPVGGTNRLTSRHGYKGLAFVGELVNSGDAGDAGDTGDGKIASEALANPS